ncbi:hypothetical protein PoB_005452100 [Plakobranchus ocellatus]|uniref:Uncharacterized protein n=1 Tax=Plakobranchus ocellatus TaxID=259542 RepID=A0AAV4BXZ4_9GAST|nr:hypothetical protein PoB_005452100 [Plakobranchus ocellatus]
MLLKASTAGLQDDLRDTMRAYSEEKLQLRANLSTLRLDLSQLHRDDRTVSSSDQSCGASHVSFPASDVEPELKRLMEEDEDVDDNKTTRSTVCGEKTSVTAATLPAPVPSLQLPALKGVNTPRATAAAANTNKSLRFSSNTVLGKSETKAGGEKEALDASSKKSFLKDDWLDGGQSDVFSQSKYSQDAKEHQKFKELQKNQDMLRSIGRANLREKRMNLIRLPTITSAKKRRQTTWDSGRNVSRPTGKSTVFETHPYVEASIKMKKKNFKIPAIRDPKRSEIQLDPDIPRQPDTQRKKKVQFTRPGEANTTMLTMTTNSNPNLTMASNGFLNATSVTSVSASEAGTEDPHNDSVMGGESLNTTLADTTMGDTSFQHIDFSPEQLRVLAQRRATDKTGTGEDEDIDNDAFLGHDKPGNADVETKPFSEELANMKPTDLPPLKIKKLMRKNVILHDLNMSGLSSKPAAAAGSGRGNWDKSSDLSVLTKISRLSMETEEWKSSYRSLPDPDKRNKALSDIMFAVRSRMRENEANLRFGETPRPSDEGYGFLMAEPFQHNSPRRSNKSTGKVVKGQSVRGAASLPLPSKRQSVGDSSGGRTAAQLQGYLRKVYRHRRGGPAPGEVSNRSSKRGRASDRSGQGKAAVKQQPCSQEAGKLDRHRGMGGMPVAQQA